MLSPQLFIAYYFQELSRKGISSPTIKEAVKIIFGQSSEGIRMDDPVAEDCESDDDCDDTLQGKREF